MTKDYDLSIIKNLDNDPSFLVSLLDLFLVSSEEDVELLEEHVKNENWKGIKDTVHKMRSRVQHFKMQKLMDQLKNIEAQCQTGLFDSNFNSYIVDTIAYIKKILIAVKKDYLNLKKAEQ